MARLQTVVDECLAIADAFVDISSSTYNELGAVNWEDNDKDYPLFLFDKNSINIAVNKFSRTNLPAKSTYTQTFYFFDTYEESEKASTTLQAKQDELMVIADQYFAELRGRNASGQNGFYLGEISFVPNDERQNDKLIQLQYEVELFVHRQVCTLGSFSYAGVEQPTGLVAYDNDETSIDISWTDNATAETNYEVWRSTDCDTFSLLDTIAANSTSYTDSSLPNETAYAYKVRAIDGTNDGKFSNTVLACTDTSCSSGTTPSGIAYQRPTLTGQTTSYATGDDAWNLANGVYDYTPPTYPSSFAQLDVNAVSPFTTLVSDNAFGGGDKSRFTDINGLQVYADDYVIDHLTGLGWYFNTTTSTNWATAISNANSSTQNSYNDWRIPNRREWEDILNSSTSTGLNYAPFNYSTAAALWSSSTIPSATTYAWSVFNSVSYIDFRLKTTSDNYWMVRTHYT